MKYLNYNDLNKRKNFKRIELEYNRLKALTVNRKMPNAYRFFFFMKIYRLSKTSLKVRIKNRCIITNKSQSVYRDFRLNRSTFKNLISLDLLVGVRKSSW